VPGDDDVGHGQHALAVSDDRVLVRRQRIDLGRSIGVPPQVGQRMDAVLSPDNQRGVLFGVTRGQPQLAVRAQGIAVAVVVEPQVVLVARPEVDDLGVREQRDVYGVIGMVMAQEDMADCLRSDPECSQRLEDQAGPGDHSRVGHDERLTVADEGDAAADSLARVTGVEQVDAGHAGDGTRPREPNPGASRIVSREAHNAGRRGILLAPPPPWRSRSVPSDAADLVLRGGAVHTVDDAHPTVQALAIRAGRIVGVGTDDEVGELIGARTRVIELRGRTVLPGFQDAHIHPPGSGLDELRCDLREPRDAMPMGVDALVDRIRAYATAHPDDPWILGSGWFMGIFPRGTPHRRDLDAAVGDRPAFFPNRDDHSAWVSSKALELAGITAKTPDPDGGRIERDPDGTPSGSLHEAAMDLVEQLIPPDTQDQVEAGLLHAQSELHALGITAWQDAIVEPLDQAAYLAVAGRGQLTARVVGALWWERDWDERGVDELIRRRTEGQAGRYRGTSVKIMVDGVLETFTGAMLEPYLPADGGATDRTGILFVEPDRLRRVTQLLDAAGFQVHFHAIGDRAVREALDAVEVARSENGPTDGRHHIAHIQLIHPVDVGRFGALDVVANAQPFWAAHDPQMDDLTIPFLGPERTTWQYPFKSLLRAGARLAMGSDWSVSTADPLLEMEIAVNRVHRFGGVTYSPFLLDERLTLDETIHGFTMGSAYVNHHDDETGSLTVGKLADVIVLDRDLFDRGAGEIGDARVVATFIEGEPVYEDRALES
jgi:predicted amidohydrolase YtcJ